MAREETARTKTNGASERGGFVIRKWNRQCMGAVAVDCGGADIFRANASRARQMSNEETSVSLLSVRRSNDEVAMFAKRTR